MYGYVLLLWEFLMRAPNDEWFTIVSTMSRVDAIKVLNVKREQGWKLVGFATRELELVMAFERAWRLSDLNRVKRKGVVLLKRMLRGKRNV
jgi:hypothetical protein